MGSSYVEGKHLLLMSSVVCFLLLFLCSVDCRMASTHILCHTISRNTSDHYSSGIDSAIACGLIAITT